MVFLYQEKADLTIKSLQIETLVNIGLERFFFSKIVLREIYFPNKGINKTHQIIKHRDKKQVFVKEKICFLAFPVLKDYPILFQINAT